MPSYDPGKWNDDECIVEKNNCYNYACDQITNTFAQPGKFHDLYIGDCTCDEVSSFSIKDGLLKKIPEVDCPETCWEVALYIIPDGPFGEDFHWYRKDSNGNWSHKADSRPVSNIDASNKIITDLTQADTGEYSKFCGYFCVCPDRVEID